MMIKSGFSRRGLGSLASLYAYTENFEIVGLKHVKARLRPNLGKISKQI